MLNNVNLIGRVTKDIEVRKTINGKSIINFTLAINNGKDQAGKERVQFINCQAWDKRADTIATWVKKGDLFSVSGELMNRDYNKDGVNHYSYIVNVSDFTLLGSGKKESKEDTPTFIDSDSSFIDSDNLPFY